MGRVFHTFSRTNLRYPLDTCENPHCANYKTSRQDQCSTCTKRRKLSPI